MGSARERDAGDDPATAGALTLAMSTVLLLLVALIAAAGFVVIAQRRLRQLGMLAAVGATERRLRLVLLADGAVVGVVAARVGHGARPRRLDLSPAPRLENAAGRRIDATQVPWWLVVAGMALAVVTALAAAWWPARAVARIPITQALSARPPRPRPVRRTALVAVPLIVIGFVVLSRAFEDEIQPDDVSIVAGILMLALGFLLICRTAVRLLPPIAGRLPVAARLALRDLGRHQARSGAALAAIGFGLGIPVAIIGIGSAVEYQSDRADGPGNLADDQLLVHVGDPPALVPSRTSTELDQMEAAVERLAETLDDATVVPLDAAVDPNTTVDPQVYGSTDGFPSDLLAEPTRRRCLREPHGARRHPGGARVGGHRPRVARPGGRREHAADRRPDLAPWPQRSRRGQVRGPSRAPRDAGGPAHRRARVRLAADVVRHPRIPGTAGVR